MPNYDDVFEELLGKLEQGEPVDAIAGNLEAEVKTLEPLLRLAAAVRDVPHPEPIADTIHLQRKNIRAAVQVQTQPLKRPVKRKQFTWGWLSGTAVFAAASAMTILFVMLMAAFNFWQSARNMDTARVDTVVGQMQVATNKAGTNWKNLESGDRVHPEQRIRTLGASYASLEFFEGTRTYLFPNADVTFVTLNGARKSLQVELRQNSGETWHRVTPLQGTNSFFLVRTPSGTASVHGTSFNVKVGQNGQAQFAVNSGEVRVKNEHTEVVLLAGQTTVALQDGAIAEPTYSFSVQGSLLSRDDESGIWNVSGVEFSVSAETSITGDPQLGEMVIVTGRILAESQQTADTIEKTDSSDQNAFITGVLESMRGNDWVINGRSIAVLEDTARTGQLSIGMPVKVVVNILENGTWLALGIEALAEEPLAPTPTAATTADPNAMPRYSFQPQQRTINVCDNSSVTFPVVLTNTASRSIDYAAAVQLGYTIDQGGEYVETVVVTPKIWGRIEASQSAAFKIQMSLNEAWKLAPQDSEIRLKIKIDSAANRPNRLNGRMTITIRASCEPQISLGYA
jgi:hypothetical protein